MQTLSMLALAALGLAACSRPDVFAELGLVSLALDFPHTRDRLDACRRAQEATCLAVYERVQSAKARLFEDGREEARRRTLSAIQERCSIDQENTPPEGCIGPATALFFFDTPEDNRAVQALLETSPPELLGRIISAQGRWFYAREDKASWRAWLASHELPEADRQFASRLLNWTREENLTIGAL